MQGELFWKLGALPDAALVEGLQRIVGAGRRTLAELVAHLCEVENRRLHLDAGYPSMFAYCTGRLRFSEDEASRRIDVARLARRAPIVFTLLASGRLSLSAAALLRPYVLAPNLTELVEAVSDRSVQDAREALAAFFPRPDVATSIRKLPPPRTAPAGAAPTVADKHATNEQEREPVLSAPLFGHATSQGQARPSAPTAGRGTRPLTRAVQNTRRPPLRQTRALEARLPPPLSKPNSETLRARKNLARMLETLRARPSALCPWCRP